MNRAALVLKKAPFPAIMAAISFALFLMVYWLFTCESVEPYYFKSLIFAVPFICFGIIIFFTVKRKLGIDISKLKI
ncbi:hypothetical protein [Clostridium oryzae]|uniref:Uncharacterized protein n=1 Tax=Clostridium oryzae TaxID=1450648 RepID=A0A1V4IHP5_9CLOT|nr:hypothetical protein [Clostridium oryzae]OPJ59449.1 hypothetical protein CLORY_32910 [Clostridium oryzae]